MKEESRWVVWKAEKVAGRLTKVPYSITGKKASSTDPSTWTTYLKAKEALTNSKIKFSGIGVIFTPAQTLLGIDIDHVLDKTTGTLTPTHAKIVNHLLLEADTYTEISPSGEGLHLYLALSSPLSLVANRHAPFEAYTSGRFFTYTENSYYSTPKEIRTITPARAVELLTLIGYPWGKKTATADTGTSTLLDKPLTTVFTDPEVLEHMFSSKNGDKIEALYKGDTTPQQKDTSRSDAALLNHLAFWTRKDPHQMERLWLASPLGKREKTQKRKDYRDRSIAAAIEHTASVYTSHLTEIDGLDLLYTYDSKKEKIYTQNTENMCRVLRKHTDFTGRLRYDAFNDRLEIKPHEDWRPVQDSDAILIQTKISILFGMFRKVGKDMISDAMVTVAIENTVDTAVDFIRSIEWDKTPRLTSWLTNTYGTPEDTYHQKVGSNWIKGLVKRLIQPGCKFDYVLVLEGAQGSKKSTSLFVLGTISPKVNWHVETTMSTDSKDFFEQFQGKAIIEFSEGETLSRTEVKKMKAIITTQVDRFRPSYGHFSIDHPRRCVFAMTTNQDQYLKDETGNRRWLPVTVRLPEANVEWLQENRDQLFAEAYYRLTELNETIYEFPKEETAREQELRRITDPNEERICHWYLNEISDEKRSLGITVDEVNQNALKSGFYTAMRKHEEMAITDVLKRVLKLRKKRRMIDGVQCWRWFSPESVMSDELETITEDHEEVA